MAGLQTALVFDLLLSLVQRKHVLGKTLHHNGNCNESTGAPLPMLAGTTKKELLGMNVYVDIKQDLDPFYLLK